MQIGSLEIELAANVARLSKDMDEAKRTVQRTFGNIEKDIDKIKSLLGGLFAGFSAATFVNKLVDVQRQFDVLNSSLITVTGSSANAAKEFAWIKQFAATTPFQLTEVTDAFVKMRMLGLDASRGALQSYGNTASAMGKNLNQLIEAVADASTGEFERLKEFGIKAKQEGDNVSMTFQGVTTNIRNNSAEIEQYLRKIGDNQFAGAMEARMNTLDGAISNLTDTWDELFRTISSQQAGSLIYDSVKLATGAVGDLITILNSLNGATRDNARETGAMKTTQEAVAIVFETIAVMGANLSYVLQGIGREIGGLAAQAVAAATLDFSGAKAIREAMVADAETARAEVDASTARILNARRLAEIAKSGDGEDEPRFRRLLEQTNAVNSALTTGGGTAKKAASEYEKAVKNAKQYIESLQLEIEKVGMNADQIKMMTAAREAAKAPTEALRKKIMETALALDIATKAEEDYKAAFADSTKATADAAEAHVKFIDSLHDGLKKLQDDVEVQKAHNAQIGLSKEAIAALEAAKLEDQATTLEGIAIKQLDKNLDEQQYEMYKAQAQALRDLAAEKRIGAAKQASHDAAQESLKEWEKMHDDLSRSLTDNIMRGGKNALEYIKDYARTLVLRPIVQSVVNPIAGTLTNMFMGGAGGADGGGNGLLGALSTGSSLLTIGKTIWSGFSGGMASGVGGILSKVGSTLGSSAISNFAAGMQGAKLAPGLMGPTTMGSGGAMGAGATFAKSIPIIGWIIAGMMKNASLYDQGWRPDNGTMSTAGKIIGSPSLIPDKILRALGVNGKTAAILTGSAAFAKMFGRASVGSGIAGNVTGDAFAGNAYEFQKGGTFRSSKTLLSDLDKETNDSFASTIKSMHDNFAALGESIGAGTGVLKDFNFGFRLALKDFDAAGRQKEIGRFMASMSDSMAMSFVDNFRTSIDVVQREAGQYWTNTSDGKRGGGLFGRIANAGDAAEGAISQTRQASKLDPFIDDIIRIFDAQREALAGVEGSEGQLAAFTQQLFSFGDALVENAGYTSLFGAAIDFKQLESLAVAGESVFDTFGRLSTVFAATNAIAVMLGKDAHTAFGAVGTASTAARERLIALSGGIESFASQTEFFAQNFLTESEQIAPVITQVDEALGKIGWSGIRTKEEFSRLVKSLDLGSEAGAKAYAEMMKLAPAFLQVANHTENLTNKAKELANQRTSLEIRLMELSGDAVGALAAKRNIELESIDPSLRSLQQLVWLREDEAVAAQKVAEIAAERTGLEQQLAQLLGDTASLRRAELDALNPANRALQEHIWAIEDVREAYANSVQTLRNAFSAVESSINAEKAALQVQLNADKEAIAARHKLQQDGNKAQIDAAQATASEIRSIAQALANAVKRVRVQSFETDFARLQSATSLIETARSTGNLQLPGLDDALGVLSEDNQRFYGSFEDYARAQGRAAGIIADLDKKAQSQLSMSEAVLAGLQAQNSVAKLLSDAEIAAAEQRYKDEVSRLDAQLENGRAMLEAITGETTATLSVKDAVDQLTAAYNAANAAAAAQRAAEAAARSGASGASGASGGGDWSNSYEGMSSAYKEGAIARIFSDAGNLAQLGINKADLDRFTDGSDSKIMSALSQLGVGQAAQQMLNAAMASDPVFNAPANLDAGNVYSIDFYNAAREALGQEKIAYDPAMVFGSIENYERYKEANADKYASIPSFDVGTNRVTRDTLAFVHEDERIMPAADNRELMARLRAPAQDNSRLVAAIDRLEAKVSELSADSAKTAAASKRTAEILQAVTRGGVTIFTETE